MLTFIRTAMELAQQQHGSDDDLPDLIDMLRKNMGGYKKARGYDKIHASDITKEDFCPRRVALLDIEGAKPKDQYLEAAMQATFDVGAATGDLVREQWLGQHAIGNWVCRRCGKKKMMCSKPTSFCETFSMHDKCDWRYVEVEFKSLELDVSGSIDVMVRQNTKLMLVELKIMAPDQFADLVAPLSEHRIRTNLYMKLAEESNHIFKGAVMTDRAKVLYVSRTHGKQHKEYGEVLPFKQFVVHRDDDDLVQPIARAKAVKEWRASNVMPCGLCNTTVDKYAKKCEVKGKCFSGQYPANAVVTS
jgi:hypothetical protein